MEKPIQPPFSLGNCELPCALTLLLAVMDLPRARLRAWDRRRSPAPGGPAGAEGRGQQRAQHPPGFRQAERRQHAALRQKSALHADRASPPHRDHPRAQQLRGGTLAAPSEDAWTPALGAALVAPASFRLSGSRAAERQQGGGRRIGCANAQLQRKSISIRMAC